MENKTILITGVSRGLGFALADYWKDKNTVIGISRSSADNLSPNIDFYSCDLGNQEELISTAQEILKKHKKIDVLINNAAVLTSLPLGIMKYEDIASMIDINLKAPIIISKIIFRNMIKNKSGDIINISSMAPKMSVVGDSVYAATKSGLESFAKVLNREGHSFGVHVNNLGISAYPSGMLGQIVKDDDYQKIIDLIPHKKFAELDEVVKIIEFFVTKNRDIGGQTIYLGGVS